MRKSYKFRIYPAKAEEAIIQDTLNTCRILYNDSLSARKDAYEERFECINYYDQADLLKVQNKESKWLAAVYSQVLQDVLKRLDKAYQNFFRRVKAGDKPGYPRFRGYDRYDSFTYPQKGYKIVDNKLVLSKIGTIKIKMHRPIPEEAKIKTCTVKREANRWFAVFTVELPDSVPEECEIRNTIGLDLGLTSLITTSTGEKIDNPRWLRTTEKKLAKSQRKLSRNKKGSKNRKKQKLEVQIVHRKIRNQRSDFLHKVSKKLVDKYDFIAMEQLTIKGMMKNRYLAKSISDVGWNQLTSLVAYKAEGAGKIMELVNPKGTSQECSRCGAVVSKTLAVRTHRCPYCRLVMDRDENAAINILNRAMAKVGMGRPEFTPVEILAGVSMKQDAYAL